MSDETRITVDVDKARKILSQAVARSMSSCLYKAANGMVVTTKDLTMLLADLIALDMALGGDGQTCTPWRVMGIEVPADFTFNGQTLGEALAEIRKVVDDM